MSENGADKQQGTAGRLPGRPFQPGQSGNPKGRPRGYDWRAIVEAARGDTVEEKLVGIWDMVVAKAIDEKDIPAAKLIVERFCTADPTEVHLFGSMSDAEAARQIAAILTAAETRARGEST